MSKPTDAAARLRVLCDDARMWLGYEHTKADIRAVLALLQEQDRRIGELENAGGGRKFDCRILEAAQQIDAATARAEAAERALTEESEQVVTLKKQLSVQEERTSEWHQACEAAERALAEHDSVYKRVVWEKTAAISAADFTDRYINECCRHSEAVAECPHCNLGFLVGFTRRSVEALSTACPPGRREVMAEVADLPRVLVTRSIVGIAHMQVCAVADATDEEILKVCNRENQSGTELGWTAVCRADSEFWGKTAPVPCDDDETRLHFMVAC